MKNKLKIHKAVYLEETKIYLKTIADCDGQVYLGRITSKDEDVTCKRCVNKINSKTF